MGILIKEICCIGAGYVGGPSMAVIAHQCKDIEVEVVDLNEEKISLWNSGNLEKLPVFEPGLSKLIKECRNKNLIFSTKLKNAIETSDMIFIAVKAINIDFTFSQIVIFFIIYSFLGQVPITPKNLGISELVFGLTSINMGMGFEIGFFIILILRLFSFFNLIFFVIIYNLIPIKNYK